MRVEKITFENYRQFRDLKIQFDKNMHVVLGVMGTGKTNILNAINWCLYGEEPYLSRASQQLPLVNLNAVDAAKDNKEPVTVRVELWIKTRNNMSVIFSRAALYLIVAKEKKKEPRLWKSPEFTVKKVDEKGNADILEDEDAKSEVERFFPEGIKEFFFFDGERLDRYFREATGDQISHEILKISQIELLERIKERLDATIGELTREAGRQNPTIKETADELEQKKKEHDVMNGRMKKCKGQIRIAKERTDEFKEKLKGIPDVEKLAEERSRLKEEMGRKKDLHKEKTKEKENLLFEHGKIMMFFPAIEESLRIIKEKRKRKEIPPPAVPSLLEDILRTRNCSICGRKFGPRSKEEKHVKDLLSEIKSSSDIIEKLLKIEKPLESFKEKIKQFEEDIQKITRDIQEYKRDIGSIQGRINWIDQQLIGHDVKKIAGWHEQLKKFEEIYDKNQQSFGLFKSEADGLNKNIGKLNDKLNKELKKEEKVKDLRKYINFGRKTLDTVDEAKNAIMEQVKTQIETEGNERFSELMWKKRTYEKFYIDEGYDLHLKHKAGYEALGTISGGEREVLALSFTMALHKVSGFDAPIMIDRPFAMVSGEPIEHVARVLSKLSKEKQVVLLLTPDDYRNVGKFWDKKVYRSYELKLTKDEKEVRMEVL